jgi:hypothetical protein
LIEIGIEGDQYVTDHFDNCQYVSGMVGRRLPDLALR